MYVITFEQLIKAVSTPRVTDLNFSAFSPRDIVCRNPETADLTDEPPVDLAVSFVSCGFH